MITFDIVNTPDKFKFLTAIGNTPEIVSLYQVNGDETHWQPLQGYMYLLIYEDGNCIGFAQLRLITTVLAEVHPCVLPQYWGKNYGVQLFEAFKPLAGKLTTLMIPCPKQCGYVKNSLIKCGARYLGEIKDGIVYKGKLQDLDLYLLDMKSSE